MIEIDRVGHVEAVKRVLHFFEVSDGATVVEVIEAALTPGRADIVFRARAGQRRELAISVEVELDFPLAPPGEAVFLLIGDDPEKYAKKAAAPADRWQELIIPLQCRRVFPAEMGMEIKDVLGMDVSKRVIDVVVKTWATRVRSRCAPRRAWPGETASGRDRGSSGPSGLEKKAD